LHRAVAALDRARVQTVLVMPPPGPVERVEVERQVAAAASSSRERFRFLLGGGSLNPMIQQAVREGTVSQDLRLRFETRAAEIVEAGAVGFGEMTALHLSFNEPHPYEVAPPDHPLFLLLADLAAQYNLPIDLHLEIVSQDLSTPQGVRVLSPNNPPILAENLASFERLLAHNRQARIVWAHVGWDNTGHMTVSLLRRLLAAHPNLYLQVKPPARPAAFPENAPLDPAGSLRPDWLQLMEAFPERFVLGTDTFFNRSEEPRGQAARAARLLTQLPKHLAVKLAFGNASRVYGLGDGPRGP